MATNYTVGIIVKAGGQGVTGVFKTVEEAAKALGRELDKVQPSGKRAGNGLDEAGNAAQRTNGKIRDMFSGLGTLKGLLLGSGVALFAQQVFSARAAMEGWKNSLTSSLGSQKAAANEIAFIRSEADRLGLVFKDLVPEYAALTAATAGSALAGKSTRDIFIGIAEAATVLGLSQQKVSLALNAVQQIASKGVVSMEDLRGQLGESLPGALQLAAKAMGVTDAEFNNLVSSGKLLATDLLPKLAAELSKFAAAGLEAAKQSPAAELSRLKNAYQDALVVVSDAGGAWQSSAEVFRALRSVLETVDVQVARVSTAVQLLGADFRELNGIIGSFAGDEALIGWINTALDGIALLPANARAAVGLLLVQIERIGLMFDFVWGLVKISAERFWIGLKTLFNENVGAVQIAYVAMFDLLINKLAGFYGKIGSGIANIPGLGDLAEQFKGLSTQMAAVATFEEQVKVKVQATNQVYEDRLKVLADDEIALEANAQNRMAASDDQRDAILAELNVSQQLLATNKASAIQAAEDRKKSEAAAAAAAAAAASNASSNATSAASVRKLAEENQFLADSYQTVLQRLNPVEAIRNRAEVNIAKHRELIGKEGIDQERLAFTIEGVTKIRELDLAAIENRKVPYDEMIKKMDRELELAGLIGKAREDLVRKYQAEDQAIQVMNQTKQGGFNLGKKTVEQLAQEIEARQKQIDVQQEVSQAGAAAAQEYEQAWKTALGNVIDDALKGGKNLTEIVRNYLRDIVAQFAKKIVLDVITRYSSQGKKGGGSSSDNEEPTLFDKGVQFVSGASGVRDAYRSGDPLSGALSGATAGAVFGPVGAIVGAIVGGLAGLFGGPKPPDLRLGAQGVTRKPEQSFNTVFGAQQIGVRGGTDTQAFIKLVTDFDASIAGIIGSFGNGTAQLEAVQSRLRTWSVDLKGDAITAEAVLGSRFNAILSTFNSDIQTFVGTLGTTQERAQRLQDAAFIEGASKASALASTFNDLARILGANKIAGETVAQTYERVSASLEILRAALGISGVSLTQTGDQLIKFAADIAQAAGGTQAAAALWQAYFATFYTAEESAVKAIEQAQIARNAALQAIGLETTTTAAQYRTQFEAALPTLNAEQVVQWLRAGQAISNVISAETALTEVRAESVAEAARLTQETERLAQALQAALAAYESLSEGIAQQFADANSTPFARDIANIRTWETTQIAAFQNAAQAAGMQAARETDLARVHILAAQRISQAIIALENTGRDRVGRLRTLLAGTSQANTGVNQSQLSGISEVQSAVEDRYQRELDLLKSLNDYIKSIQFSAQSTLTPGQQLGAAQSNYENLLRRLRENPGDVEALGQLQAASQQYLQSAQQFFGVSEAYDRIFASVNSSLQAIVNAGPQNAPNTVTGGGGGGGSTGPLELSLEEDPAIAQARAERIALVNEILDIAAQVIAVTGESLGVVAERMGTTALELITALGITVDEATVATVTQLAAVAQQLGIDLSSLAADVGLELGTLNQQNSLLSQGLQAAVNTLPLAQRNQLQPLLNAITTATNEADANAAIDALETEVNKLPAGFKNQLAPYLAGVKPELVNQLTELQAIRTNTLTQAELLREIRDKLPRPPTPGTAPDAPATLGTNPIISVGSSNTATAPAQASTAQSNQRERELQMQLKANERALRDVTAMLTKISEQHAAQTRVLREVSEKVR